VTTVYSIHVCGGVCVCVCVCVCRGEGGGGRGNESGDCTDFLGIERFCIFFDL